MFWVDVVALGHDGVELHTAVYWPEGGGGGKGLERTCLFWYSTDVLCVGQVS